MAIHNSIDIIYNIIHNSNYRYPCIDIWVTINNGDLEITDIHKSIFGYS
jgi:hypothetical protein